jgi:hypothetical protein
MKSQNVFLSFATMASLVMTGGSVMAADYAAPNVTDWRNRNSASCVQFAQQLSGNLNPTQMALVTAKSTLQTSSIGDIQVRQAAKENALLCDNRVVPGAGITAGVLSAFGAILVDPRKSALDTAVDTSFALTLSNAPTVSNQGGVLITAILSSASKANAYSTAAVVASQLGGDIAKTVGPNLAPIQNAVSSVMKRTANASDAAKDGILAFYRQGDVPNASEFTKSLVGVVSQSPQIVEALVCSEVGFNNQAEVDAVVSDVPNILRLPGGNKTYMNNTSFNLVQNVAARLGDVRNQFAQNPVVIKNVACLKK